MAWISENRVAVVLLVVIAVVAIFATRGCNDYAEVNGKTYAFAQALLQTAMRRDDPRTGRTRADGVAEVERQMMTAQEAGEISDSEIAILNEMIKLTKAEKWAEAKIELRSLLDSQVK